jgi:hypothetical protein
MNAALISARRVLVLGLACLSLVAWPLIACGQTAYPMLMSIRPVAIQAGSSAEMTVSSRYTMFGAYQILVSGADVTGEVIPPETKQEDPAKKPTVEKLKVRFTATSDALPGVRDIRVATAQGVSTVGQLVVVRDPVIVESGNNETPAQSQQISLPAAVCGTIEKNEDVDFFRFHVESGQALAMRMRCARLEDRIHDLQTHADPILTIKTVSGATIAMSDNDSYYADPVLAHRFDQAGDYLIEVRDVRYQGNQYWEYCIEINSRPLAETVFPLAVAPGQTESLEPVGNLMEDHPRVDWTVPANQPPGIAWVSLPLASETTNPVPLIVTDVPLVRETDGPNDSPPAAQFVDVPSGVNGRLAQAGDVDCYAFEAKKGESLSFEVIARRVQSAVDSQIRILDSAGKQLTLNDDLKLGKRGFADSWIENWTVPADGKYVIEIRDVHLRGGPAFPYFLKITRSQPYFELYLDADKTQVCPGGCAALFVRMDRKNGFTGEVQLAIEGLPPGVTASCGRILADQGQDGCIVLQAAPDAQLAVSNIVVTGRAEHTLADGTVLNLSTTALPYQETYQPGGGRGHWPVAAHAVAVSDVGDIRGITLSTSDIVLKPGGSQRIEVTIDRNPGFNANVTLDMLMRHLNSTYANTLPPGVTLNDKDAKSLLSGSATQGYLTLTAAKDAPPIENQQAVVVAHVALNFVMKWTYASPPITITVAKLQP